MTSLARLPSWSGAQRSATGPQSEPPIANEIYQARILIVDDVDANVRLLQRMLTGARYAHVDTCVDPCIVFELHRTNRYDLILLDLEMPRMNGFEVMEALREIDPDGAVPVIVLAAQQQDRLRALRAGAKDFLSKPFDLTEVLTRIAVMLEVRMLHIAMRQRHKGLERELAVAAEIYRALLPASLPGCPGYELAAVSRSADDTSGDVYDVVARPDGNLVVLVADATGHGVGPALSATQLRSMVRMALRLGAPLDRIVAEADRQLADDLPSDRFVTAFIGELDPNRHTLEYLAPGQGPLLHWHAETSTAEWRNASAPPFGVANGPFEPPPPMVLAVGDVVVLATDGVYERTSTDGVLFGESGVESVMRDAGHSSAQAIGALLQTRTDHFGGPRPPSDDATVLILKRIA
jgi:sigma-B regulation protein RsbU (phosphoserine phosphatase)